MSVPEIAALQKRCKRYRRMTFFSLLAVVTLAFAPALYRGAVLFTLYGIALFGVLAVAGSLLQGYYARKLAANTAGRIAD